MTESFLPEADEEFREAARYYEHECPGLGLTFTGEVGLINPIICKKLSSV